MSQPRPPRRHLDATQGREVVYCHACEHEWYRDEQPSQAGLECPRCHGEIIEIVSPESDPRPMDDDGPDINYATRPGAYDNHHGSDSDPEEADIDQHVHHMPNQGFFMHRTIRPGGVANHDDPEFVVLRRFTDMINDFNGGPQRGARQAPLFPQMPGGDVGDGARGASPGPRQPGQPGQTFVRTTFTNIGPTRVTITTANGLPQGMAGGLNFDEVFGNLMGGPHAAGEHPQGRQGVPPLAASLHGLIAMFLGQPPGGVHGDAVYSQEALDRIITQLMEQNPLGSNAAPPASEDAISKLQKRNVVIEDLGSDGKAECTICIDELKVGDEVTVLPCKHWFHGECVTLWLKEHNTCPICRTPIEANRNNNGQGGQQQHDQQQGQQSGQQQGNDQPQPHPGQRQDQFPGQMPGQFGGNFAWSYVGQWNQGQPENQQPDTSNQDPTPSSSRSRYERLFRNSEDRLNSIRNLGGASYRPSPSRMSSSSQQQQQQGTSQRRSSHSPPPEPENRTPRVRSPDFRSRDPFEYEQQQRQDRPMSGYDADPYRRGDRESDGGRDRENERASGPLNWLRDQFNRHTGSSGPGGSGGTGSGSGSGAGDKRRS